MLAGCELPSTNLDLDFATRDDLDDKEELDLGEEVDLDFFLFCFFFILETFMSDPDCCMYSPKSWDDHGESAEPELPIDVAVKSAVVLNSFIQLGALPEGPSQPMCATCLTSVGVPISISRSFTTKI